MKKKRISGFLIGMLGTLLISSFSCAKEYEEPKDTYLKPYIVDACERVAKEYNICPELIMAIIEHESAGVVDIKNKKSGATGLMQIMPGCHKERTKRLAKELGVDPDLTLAYLNIYVGCDYLSELFETYGDVAIALDYYAGYDGALNEKLGKCSKYSENILKRSEELEMLHDK